MFFVIFFLILNAAFAEFELESFISEFEKNIIPLQDVFDWIGSSNSAICQSWFDMPRFSPKEPTAELIAARFEFLTNVRKLICQNSTGNWKSTLNNTLKILKQDHQVSFYLPRVPKFTFNVPKDLADFGRYVLLMIIMCPEVGNFNDIESPNPLFEFCSPNLDPDNYESRAQLISTAIRQYTFAISASLEDAPRIFEEWGARSEQLLFLLKKNESNVIVSLVEEAEFIVNHAKKFRQACVWHVFSYIYQILEDDEDIENFVSDHENLLFFKCARNFSSQFINDWSSIDRLAREIYQTNISKSSLDDKNVESLLNPYFYLSSLIRNPSLPIWSFDESPIPDLVNSENSIHDKIVNTSENFKIWHETSNLSTKRCFDLKKYKLPAKINKKISLGSNEGFKEYYSGIVEYLADYVQNTTANYQKIAQSIRRRMSLMMENE